MVAPGKCDGGFELSAQTTGTFGQGFFIVDSELGIQQGIGGRDGLTL